MCAYRTAKIAEQPAMLALMHSKPELAQALMLAALKAREHSQGDSDDSLEV